MPPLVGAFLLLGKVSATKLERLWRLRHNTARSDILAPDQPQPVEPLFIRQDDAAPTLAICHALPPEAANIAQAGVFHNRLQPMKRSWLSRQVCGADFPSRPILPSVPNARRAILARCMIQMSAVSARKTSAVRRWSKRNKIAGVAALAISAASDE